MERCSHAHLPLSLPLATIVGRMIIGRPLRSPLTSATGHELIDDHDYDDYDQDMDEPARHMEDRKAKQPQNQEDDSNSPKHSIISLDYGPEPVQKILKRTASVGLGVEKSKSLASPYQLSDEVTSLK